MRSFPGDTNMGRRVVHCNGRIGGFSLMRVVWYGALCLALTGAAFGQNQQQQKKNQPQQPQNVPSAPVPQAPAPQPNSLQKLAGQVTPGIGTNSPDVVGSQNAGQSAPHIENGAVTPQSQQTPPPDDFQKTPPMMPKKGESPVPPPPPPPQQNANLPAGVPLFHTNVTVVDVPVIVQDKHGHDIGGLPWWRFRIYQDGVRQRIWYFTTDAYPLSIAFVIDNTLPTDIMHKVNESLSAIGESLTPQDTVALITYAGTSPQLVTDFTAANGQRLTAALHMAKHPGEQMGVPDLGDPLNSGPMVNGMPADPTLTPQIGNSGPFLVMPREVHPLNDAILYAAEQLASQPRGRRRIIYVVSDGKDVGSKAKFKEVLRYLQMNNIAVYGTQVGDSALWGIGYLDRMKLPFLQPADVLPRYAYLTGGLVSSQLTENGIQNAFIQMMDSARTAYTIDYLSHQSTLGQTYHSIDVRVEGLPNLNVYAKQGYYPAASPQY